MAWLYQPLLQGGAASVSMGGDDHTIDTQEAAWPFIADAATITQNHDLTPHAVPYKHLRAHDTSLHLVCRLLLEKTNKKTTQSAI